MKDDEDSISGELSTLSEPQRILENIWIQETQQVPKLLSSRDEESVTYVM